MWNGGVRLAFEHVARVHEPREDGASRWHRPLTSRHAFLEIRPAGADVRVFGVHSSAVHAAWTERRRALELGALLPASTVMNAGFTSWPVTSTRSLPASCFDVRKLPHRLRALVWMSGGRIRWRTIQIILDAGYVMASAACTRTIPG